MLFLARWVMVGRMVTARRSVYGSTAFAMVVGLLMLALMFVASSPAWYGSDPAHRTTNAAVEVWAPGAWMAQSSTVPAGTIAPEHPPVVWRLRHMMAVAEQPPLLTLVWPDQGAIRSPQQMAHSAGGSRSPPASRTADIRPGA
jgi:hypothetical protein